MIPILQHSGKCKTIDPVQWLPEAGEMEEGVNKWKTGESEDN